MKSTTVATPDPQPCPSCGHCPTCGRRPTAQPYPYYPWVQPGYPYPIWVSTGADTNTSGSPSFTAY